MFSMDRTIYFGTSIESTFNTNSMSNCITSDFSKEEKSVVNLDFNFVAFLLFRKHVRLKQKENNDNSIPW